MALMGACVATVWAVGCGSDSSPQKAPDGGDASAGGAAPMSMPDTGTVKPSPETGPPSPPPDGPLPLPEGGVHRPEAGMPGRGVPESGVPEGGTPEGGAPEDHAEGSVTPTITLVGSDPADGASNVPATAWVRLDFAPPLVPSVATVTLDCGAGTPDIDVDALGTTLVVNPRAPLPAQAMCTVSYAASAGTEHIGFTVAAKGAAAVVPYDRNDASAFGPFPDDFYVVADSSTRTGLRTDIRTPAVDAQLAALFEASIAPTRTLDGMSPLGPIVVPLPAALLPGSIPLNARASLDAFASLGLFDIDASSPAYGKRIPFDALLRNETDLSGTPAHVLVAFPSVPLRSRGHYAFVVTGRALVSAESPLEASAFFAKVAAQAGTTDDEKRLQPALGTVLTELGKTSPPLRTDDIALALGISVRSTDDIASDLLSVRAQTLAAPPPAFTVTSSVAGDPTAQPDIAAIVQGTWSPLRWTTDGKFIDRDAAGAPKPGDVKPIPFTLILPKGNGPAPLVMYQHGQPIGASELVRAAEVLAKSGFALIGFTDIVNREVIPTGDVAALNRDALLTLIVSKRLPDYLELLTHAEQLSFLRMIPTMGSVDVLPLGAPDGKPDIDPSRPLGYIGISQGSIHGIGLLALAPEIHAAVLAVGAGRFSASLVHQQSEQLYQGIAGAFTSFTHAQFYAGLSLLQAGYDHQDSQNLADFVYRHPLALETGNRASILMIEGLGDSEVPYYAVRSGAAALGLSQLATPAEPVPFLDPIQGPVHANQGSTTTAAFFQYVPKGLPGFTSTPGCVAIGEIEGHFCAQSAPEAITQRMDFLVSALSGVPTIK
jgi:hypothetical protein